MNAMPRHLLSIVLTALWLPGAASAQTGNIAFGGLRADTSAPVEVTADQLSVSQTDGSAVFTGNVLVIQGDMRLSAGAVTVIYRSGDRGRIESLLATGDVMLVSGADAAEAQEALYTVENGIVEMSGAVLLTQGQNVISGEKLVVDLASGTGRMDGRVRTILNPGGN